MTVMPSGSDVADKAVSTEDASSGVEVVRLEAVLAALVETKVEAMKASSAATTTTSSKGPGSAPPSPRRPRLTSSSTASSSQNQHHHHQHLQNNNHQQHHNGRDNSRHSYDSKKRDAHRHRRHDSAPCGDFIKDPTTREHHKPRSDKARRRASEMPRSARKKRRHSKSPQILQDVNLALDSRFELLGIDGNQDLALINFERTREAFSESCEYPELHRSACYFSHSAAHLKIHYDEDDYVTLNLEDDFAEEESLNGLEKRDDKRKRYHRPRRKRKRRRRITKTEVPDFVDPEELPPRARWTIVVTACLLLAMALLLVGVTLRMAPIIDDMGRRETMDSSGYRKSYGRRNSGFSSEKIVFYVDEAIGDPPQDPLTFDQSSDLHRHFTCHGLYPPRPTEIPGRSNSVCSQSDRPRRSRYSTDSEHSGSRRTSIHSNRSRTNSCSRPTPLGDGRRASVCRKGPSRRASTAVGAGGTSTRRKDSVRPTTRVEIRESSGKIVVKTPLELDQARRHRKITMIVVGTFLFLLIASILVVVVTLTHSSFHTPAIGSKELAEHRAQHNHQRLLNETLRKENEELLNSLNRDSSVPENSTAPP